MNMMPRIAVLAALCLLAAACNPAVPEAAQPPEVTPGDVQVTNLSIERGSASSARVTLDMDGGTLFVSGGAAGEVMEGEFRYDVAEWQPAVTEDVVEGEAQVMVTQGRPEESFAVRGQPVNEWDVRLTGEVPLALDVNDDSGDVTIRPDGVNLSALDVSVQAGNIALALEGDYPALVGITLQGDTGNLDAVLSGTFESLESITASLTAGDASFDLSGIQQHSMNLALTTEAGSITVRVPGNVNVSANATGSEIVAENFRQEGDTYTRAAEDTDVTITLDVHAATGTVTLELID